MECLLCASVTFTGWCHLCCSVNSAFTVVGKSFHVSKFGSPISFQWLHNQERLYFPKIVTATFLFTPPHPRTLSCPTKTQNLCSLTLNLGEVLLLPQSSRSEARGLPGKTTKGAIASAQPSPGTLTLGSQPPHFEEAHPTQERLRVGILANRPH